MLNPYHISVDERLVQVESTGNDLNWINKHSQELLAMFLILEILHLYLLISKLLISLGISDNTASARLSIPIM